MNGSAPAPYHTSASSIIPSISNALAEVATAAATTTITATAANQQQQHQQSQQPHFSGPLSSLRKIITSTLAPSPSQTQQSPSQPLSRASSPSASVRAPTSTQSQYPNLVNGNGATNQSQSHSQSHGHPQSPPPAFQPPTPLLPKDNILGPVTAPTPTSSPYTWSVPESSTILSAFLSLVYPRGTFTSRPTSLLSNPDITGRVIRAALGYQSTKALTLARDHLSQGAWIEEWPLEIYSLACFFKFGDLARLASGPAVRSAPTGDWSVHRPVMGRQGLSKLLQLHQARVEGFTQILEGGLEEDDHTSTCPLAESVRRMWEVKIGDLRDDLEGGGADCDLLELLEMDLSDKVRGGGYSCGGCLVNLGKTIQRCLVQARELPTTI